MGSRILELVPPGRPVGPDATRGGTDIVFRLPDDALETIARRAAELVLAQLPASSVSPFMTIPEAAEFLRCRRQRVDDLLSQRRLTRRKEGGRTLVSRAEVESLVVAHSLPRGLRSRIERSVA